MHVRAGEMPAESALARKALACGKCGCQFWLRADASSHQARSTECAGAKMVALFPEEGQTQSGSALRLFSTASSSPSPSPSPADWTESAGLFSYHLPQRHLSPANAYISLTFYLQMWLLLMSANSQAWLSVACRPPSRPDFACDGVRMNAHIIT